MADTRWKGGLVDNGRHNDRVHGRYNNRQPKRYGSAIPLPCLGVSVMVSKVSRAAAPKGTQSCTTHGFYVTLIFFFEKFSGVGLRGKRGGAWGA